LTQGYQLILPKNGVPEEILSSSSSETAAVKLYENALRIKHSYGTNHNNELRKQLCQDSKILLYDWTGATAYEGLHRNKDFKRTYKTPIGFALAKNSEFKDLLNNKLSKLREAGLFERWRNQYFHGGKPKIHFDDSRFFSSQIDDPLSLSHVRFPILIVLFGGIGLSILALCLEIATFILRKEDMYPAPL